MLKPPKYSHVSFAFQPEDKTLLQYCADQSGLSQTELIRRLLQNYAAGAKLVGIVEAKPLKSAKAWVKATTP